MQQSVAHVVFMRLWRAQSINKSGIKKEVFKK